MIEQIHLSDSKSRGTFGTNLEQYRKKSGLTQQQVAEKLNVDRTTYTKYETGVSEPSLESLEKIADLLNVDVNSLIYDDASLHDTGVFNSKNSYESRLFSVVKDMPEDEREKLLAYARQLGSQDK